MNVTVYGRHSCQPCRATVRRLVELGVDHQFVDIDSVSSGLLAQLSRHVGERASLPVVIVRGAEPPAGNVWAGYRPDRIDALAGVS